ncbi:hypothetical protein STEG23_008695 [Scotinomys teguina]
MQGLCCDIGQQQLHTQTVVEAVSLTAEAYQFPEVPLLIVDLSVCANGILFRKSCPMSWNSFEFLFTYDDIGYRLVVNCLYYVEVYLNCLFDRDLTLLPAACVVFVWTTCLLTTVRSICLESLFAFFYLEVMSIIDVELLVLFLCSAYLVF